MHTFNKILVALDGSKNGQIAADYGFLIASKLNATLAAQHVVDPRLVDLFIEPEFASELGILASIENSEKVFCTLRKIGALILDRFATEARHRGFEPVRKLSEGRIVEEILRFSKDFDLLVVGHRGRGERKTATNLVLGSVAERLVISAEGSVLVAVQPIEQIEFVVVAYDGSEAANGALLVGENLAKNIDAKLKAVVVTSELEDESKSRHLIEKGQSLLRECCGKDVFSIKSGSASQHVLDAAGTDNSLFVLGAYGFRDPNETVLGGTTMRAIRETERSVLIYRQPVEKLTGSRALEKAFKLH